MAGAAKRTRRKRPRTPASHERAPQDYHFGAEAPQPRRPARRLPLILSCLLFLLWFCFLVFVALRAALAAGHLSVVSCS